MNELQGIAVGTGTFVTNHFPGFRSIRNWAKFVVEFNGNFYRTLSGK